MFEETEIVVPEGMWYHYCEEHQAHLSTANGEECTWCGATEWLDV